MKDIKSIKKQSSFCSDLMKRLNEDIQGSDLGIFSGMENHCRKREDIRRIRRELLDLAKMLDPWN